MIEHGAGNLLTADVEALVNTVNTVGVMGKGIALQFKRAYPANYGDYRAACERGEVRLGRVHVFDSHRVGLRRYVLNFPTKGHWRSTSSLADIQTGLDDLVRVVTELGIGSVAIPPLGCGNGGLNWDEVRPLIERACERMPDVRAVVYPPDGAPDPAAMPVATMRPAMTAVRALLVAAVARYSARAAALEGASGTSELEVQKLAYFLQEFGAPLDLRFSRGRYGPYSERLASTLSDLEGHHIIGLGDRSARVTELAPINAVPGSADEAEAVLARHPEQLGKLDAVMALVRGFETPYSVELLATVHFAANHEPSTADPVELSRRVTEWNIRKARLFTEAHVALAAGRLAEHALLSSTLAAQAAGSRS